MVRRSKEPSTRMLLIAFVLVTALLGVSLWGLLSLFGAAAQQLREEGGLRPIVAKMWCGSADCLNEKPTNGEN